MKQISVLLLFIYFSNNLIFAQSIEQKAWLLENAEKIHKTELQKKAEADSLAKLNGLPIIATLSDGSIIVLQSFEDGIPNYHITDNLNAAATISTKQLWNNELGGFSLSGNGQLFGLWEVEGTPLITHQELAGRITQKDEGGSTTPHATHVAGTLIATGINPNTKGMSNQGTINAYNSTNDLSEIMTAAANGLKISNHSYGLIMGWHYNHKNDGKWAWFGNTTISTTEDYRFGFYTSNSFSWDNFLVNAPNILVCKSAGNDRGQGPAPGTQHWVISNNNWVPSSDVRDKDGGPDGYDCISDPVGIAKNTLTVGAVNDIPNSYTSPSSVVMTSFSNWGPTDDGRIKPDIVANGVGLYSSSNTSNTAYESMDGTSMSSPNAAGSVGLILEQQATLNGVSNPLRSSTLKALIINTADEAGQNPGPDYIFGWGLMNTYRAVQTVTLDHEAGNNKLIKELELTQGGTSEFQVQSNGIEPLKVTICWIDPAGLPPPNSLNPRNKMLVNDLDLTITGPNSTVYQPWVLDPNNPSAAAATGDNTIDNVEQVFIESPIAGTYTIKVSHKGTLNGSLQKFSIVLNGIDVPVPEAVTLIEPVDNIQNVFPEQILFKWTRAPKSMKYQLQLSTDSTFATTILEQVVNGVYTKVAQVPENSTLFWRVRATNGGGNGVWSEVRKLNTSLGMPTLPILISPEDYAVHQDLDLHFNWEVVSNADSYRIQISNNPPFTSLVVNDSTLTSNSYLADNLGEGKRMFWRVNAKNIIGTGPFSATRNFTTKLLKPDSLTVTVNVNNHAVLNWNDKSSAETKYMILRRTPSTSLTTIDSLGANVTTYTDTSAQYGVGYYYAVYCKNTTAQSDTSDESNLVVVKVEQEDNPVPTKYSLGQNYPNPFNPSTVIKYSIAKDGFVDVSVFNLLGEKVATLVNRDQKAGSYEVNFNASKLSSGVYFYSVESGDFKAVRKMLLMK